MDAGPAGDRRLTGVRLPLAVYVASRLVVAAVASVVALAGTTDPGQGPWPSLGVAGPQVLRVLGRWESAWYLDIVVGGYPSQEVLPDHLRSIAFFPLLPGLVRVASEVTGLSPLLVGVLLAHVVGALAIVLVWRLVAAISGQPAADRSPALLCAFPGSFALSMVYSEPFLVAGAAGCLLALHRRAWLQAGIFGAVASASRPSGGVVVAACAFAALTALPGRRDWRALQAPAVAALGGGSYLAYLRVHTGSWSVWFRSQREGWHDTIDFGRHAVERVRVVADEGPHLGLQPLQLNDAVGAAGIVFLVAGLVLLWRWRPPGAVSVAIGVIAVAVASADVGPRPGMLLGAFPLVVAIAVTVKGQAFLGMLVASTIGLVTLSSVIFTSLAATP